MWTDTFLFFIDGFEMVLTQCDSRAVPLNVNVAQNKRGRTTGVTVTLLFIFTSLSFSVFRLIFRLVSV